MEENRKKQNSRNHIVRNLTIALIVVLAIAVALLTSYALTTDQSRTVLAYVAVAFLPIILIVAYALAIAILHRRRTVPTQTQL